MRKTNQNGNEIKERMKERRKRKNARSLRCVKQRAHKYKFLPKKKKKADTQKCNLFLNCTFLNCVIHCEELTIDLAVKIGFFFSFLRPLHTHIYLSHVILNRIMKKIKCMRSMCVCVCPCAIKHFPSSRDSTVFQLPTHIHITVN